MKNATLEPVILVPADLGMNLLSASQISAISGKPIIFSPDKVLLESGDDANRVRMTSSRL